MCCLLLIVRVFCSEYRQNLVLLLNTGSGIKFGCEQTNEEPIMDQVTYRVDDS